ncbi:hypothetical protein [Bradyrhizobium sp. USDA 4545]|uniref:hypothetical protein n=1 Tax=Bradyrhizobium sp. USDA 4545 TaxID=2817705 RepID=UPI0020A49260|nr:hypothetical protein [Bradyrhizobium sp. USDA 4545]MCP1832780.1 hypothetical protein [Bradyrhizobium sp. USDA 4545]
MALRMLRFGPIERRPRGWRFGTLGFSDHVIARLVESGRAEIVGERVIAASTSEDT